MKILLVCLLILCAPAFAGIEQNQTQAPKVTTAPPAPPKSATPAPVKTGSPSVPKPSASASATANQQQQQQQAQQQRQTAKGGNAHSASAATATNDSRNSATGGDASGQSTDVSSEYREVRNTPPAFAGTVQPTASCKNAINGGASAPVAGLSFGFGRADEECDRREIAREFYEMGQEATAIAILCKSKLAKDIPNCAIQVTAVTVTDEYPPGERERRIHTHHAEDLQK